MMREMVRGAPLILMALVLVGCGPGTLAVGAAVALSGGGGDEDGRPSGGDIEYAIYIDANKSGSVDGPDVVVIAFRREVKIQGDPVPDSVFALDPSGTFGPRATIVPGAGPREVVVHRLVGASLQPKGIHGKDAISTGVDLVAGSLGITDSEGKRFHPGPRPVDLGGELLVRVESAYLSDTDLDCAVSSGDTIEITFTADVSLRTVNPLQVFTLLVPGDTLGQGAQFLGGLPTDVRVVEISLGTGPVLTVPGTFHPGSTLPGSPTGIDLGDVQGLVVDSVFPEIPAVPRFPPGVDLGGPSFGGDDLQGARYVDENGNGVVDNPDTLVVSFCQDVVVQGTPLADSVFDLSPPGSFGFSATVVPGPSARQVILVDLDGPDLQPNGTHGTHPGSSGLNVRPGQTVLTDASLTPIQPAAAPVEIEGELNPRVIRVSYANQNSDCGPDAGDTLEVVFSDLVTFTGSDPDDAFQLPVTGDSLGTGATIAGGLPVMVDRITVVLGDSPVLQINGAFDPMTTSPGSSSGLDVRGNGVVVDAAHPVVRAAPWDPPGAEVEGESGLLWSVEGESNRSEELGYSAMAAGDVNGDGHADVIIGAPGANPYGRAYLYLGAPAGLPAAPDWSTTADGSTDADYGDSVAGAGDVNGDGFDDIIVGAPLSNAAASSAGKAFLFLGGPGGPPATPDWTTTGEGLDRSHLGSAVAGAGDVDGDGFGDVVIGAETYEVLTPFNEGGKAYLYRGGPSGLEPTPLWESVGEAQEMSKYGNAVASAGDVNGDGYDDILIGANEFDSPQPRAGKVYLHLGGPGGPSTTADWTSSGDDLWRARFGSSLARAGDIDDDGRDDVIIGAPFADTVSNEEGKAYVYLGETGGLSAFPAWSSAGDNVTRAAFGSGVGSAGDQNGDGYDDIIVGAAGRDTPTGKIFIFLSGPGGLSAAPAWTHKGDDQPFAYFGGNVGTAGDVNLDGWPDTYATSYRFNGIYNGVGKVHIFCGGM
jgi:hypothetical protein